MVFYECQRCGYSTKNRTYYRKHLHRKYPCKPKKSDISIATLQELFNAPKVPHFPSKPVPHFPSIPESSNSLNFPHLEPSNSLILESQIEPYYQCIHCQKIYSRKDNLKRHEKTCLSKQKEKTSIVSQLNHLIQQEEIYKEREKNWKQEKQDLMNQIELLLTKVGNNNHNTYINQQNIILNNFGEENVEYIKDMFYKDIIQQGPYGSIPKLVKQIHFNQHHPENMNLKLDNKQDDCIKVFSGGGWKDQNKKDTIEQLVDNNFIRIDTKYNVVKSELPEYKQGIYTNYKEKTLHDKETKKNIQKEVEKLIQ